jgi:hypothetical protein
MTWTISQPQRTGVAEGAEEIRRPGAQGPSAICTLFERDFHFGVGALVNSLYAHGYRGLVYAGYRGQPPPWARAASGPGAEDVSWSVDGLEIRFVPVRTRRHLTNFKPDFMRMIWDEQCPDARLLFYFDPDIVVQCRWSFFEEWAEKGVALCEEITNGNMPRNHPIRLAWLDLLDGAGMRCVRPVDRYYNGGFIGLRRDSDELLSVWARLMDALEENHVAVERMMPGDRSDPFYATDQDMLNAAVMASDAPLSTIGPEGMGFVPGGFTMLHAVGTPKPWRQRMTLDALRGRGPGNADKGFWRYTQGPVPLYSSPRRAIKLLDLKIGAAIGRVLRRA